jgi:hypothetical protein
MNLQMLKLAPYVKAGILWNQLPAEVLGILLCKPNTLKKRVRKVIK